MLITVHAGRYTAYRLGRLLWCFRGVLTWRCHVAFRSRSRGVRALNSKPFQPSRPKAADTPHFQRFKSCSIAPFGPSAVRTCAVRIGQQEYAKTCAPSTRDHVTNCRESIPDCGSHVATRTPTSLPACLRVCVCVCEREREREREIARARTCVRACKCHRPRGGRLLALRPRICSM